MPADLDPHQTLFGQLDHNFKWQMSLRFGPARTCGDLNEEGDGDGDGEDEHGEDDHLQTLLAVVHAALPKAVRHVAPRAARREQTLKAMFFLVGVTLFRRMI